MRRILMMAGVSGALLGLADVLIRLTPLDGGSVHWHALLIAFVIMPALIVGLTRRLKEGAAPLAAAGMLVVGHVLGMMLSCGLIHGYIWSDLFTVPLMTLPVVVVAATLTRMWDRRGARSPRRVESAMPDFNPARERARARMRQ